MNVTIIATRECSHCKNLRRELEELGVEYDVRYIEECPDLVEKFAIRHSPNLVIDDELVCREQPTKAQLRQYLKLDHQHGNNP